MASQLVDTPVALLSLGAGPSQSITACFGMEPRAALSVLGLCERVVSGRGPLTTTGPGAAAPPAIAAAVDSEVVTWCGVPLIDTHGSIVGSLCVGDRRPREWGTGEIHTLERLTRWVLTEVEFGVANRQLQEREAALESLKHDVQERDRALAASEQRFRRTFDDSPIGMAITAPGGKWRDVNRRLCEILGYDRDELLALNAEAVTHPDDVAPTKAMLASLADGSAVTGEIEKRYLAKSGATVWVRLCVALVRTDAGEPMHSVCQVEDISARRAADLARREAALRHEVLLRSLPGTILAVYDDKLTCVEFQAPEYSEIPPARFVGKSLHESVTAAQADAVLPLIRRALTGESVREQLTWPPNKRVYEVQAVPYREEPGGEITGAITVARNVTELLQQARENRLLATIVQQSEDAILAKDRDGHITAWSPGAQRLYGYTSAEAIGRPVAMLIPPERFGEDRWLLGRAMAGEAVAGLHTERVRKSGERVHVSLSLSPLFDETGMPSGASVIAHDITDRVQAEAARRTAEDRLRVTVEHAPIGVALVDLEGGFPGRLLGSNEALAQMVGGRAVTESAPALLSIVHPEDVSVVHEEFVSLASREVDRAEREVRWRRPDGRTGWLLISAAAVPSAEETGVTTVVHFQDIGERKRYESQLRYLADHDALTGLFNRRRLEEELDRAAAGVRRHSRTAALLVLGLDGFRYVNDLIGRAGGDELIAQIGGLLRRTFRKTDTIARLGGDEFAVILPDTTADQAEVVAAKIGTAIDHHVSMLSDGQLPHITASIGITSFTHESDSDAEYLLGEADAAMYEAKRDGRNRWAIYQAGENPGPRIAAWHSWLERLQIAVAEDRFELMAQPIHGICAAGEEFHELLIRLRGDDGELIPPGTFLGYAERFDLIQQIDRWVLGQAVELLASAQAQGRALTLTVNMSAKTLGDPEICPDLAALLARYRIRPGSLVVEVTETAAIVNIDTARHVARELRKLGCRLALDDFGAGFASFYYLKHLEFDYVKIDGEFVKSLAQNVTDQLVVKSVVDIARGVGAQTVAEFVGDDETVALLQQLGVDYGQGYHLGHPEPITTALGG